MRTMLRKSLSLKMQDTEVGPAGTSRHRTGLHSDLAASLLPMDNVMVSCIVLCHIQMSRAQLPHDDMLRRAVIA